MSKRIDLQNIYRTSHFKGLAKADRVTASCHPSDQMNLTAFKVRASIIFKKLKFF